MPSLLIKMQAKFNSDSGATAVEYGLMVAMIATVIIASVALLGSSVSTLFQGATSI